MKKIILFILSIVCIQMSGQMISDTDYKYPFYAGDEKWHQYKTSEERIAALQIPDSLLCKMSTSQLLEVCLEYPYIKTILFADDLESGLSFISSSFNGVGELLKRQDLMLALVNKEQLFLVELENTLHKDNVQKGEFSFRSFLVDYLLLQHMYVSSLEKDKQAKVLGIISKNNEIKKKHHEIFGAYLLTPCQVDSNGGNLAKDTEGRPYREMGRDEWYIPDTIYTPKSSFVPDTYKYTGTDFNYSAAELENLSVSIFNTFNGATLINPPSNKYNCHGYAWHVYEGGNYVWIGYHTETAEDIYWTDGSYVQTTESDATKVSYTYGNHSAVRLNSTWYQSKWGNGPLVMHHPNDVPPGYNASQGKTYYKRAPMYISGPTVPCGESTYTVENLRNGYTVQWSLESQGSTTPSYLILNSPSINECQIVNTTGMILYDELIANIYSGTTLVATLSKTIDTSNDFIASYSQPSFTILGHTYPAINNEIIYNNGTVRVSPGGVFTITSSHFNDATITKTSGNGISWTHAGSTLIMQAAISSTRQGAFANFVGEKGCEKYAFKVIAMMAPIPDPLDFSVNIDDNNCYISLSPQNDENSICNAVGMEQKWNLSITNMVTGKKIIEKQVVGQFVSLDTSTWGKGIYAVKAIVNDHEYMRKVTL